MNKKGLTQTELAVIVIAMVVFILFLAIGTGFAKNLKEDALNEVCRDSVLLNSRLKDVSANIVGTGIECPAPHLNRNTFLKIRFIV